MVKFLQVKPVPWAERHVEGGPAAYGASGASTSGKGICGCTKLQYVVLQGMAMAFAQEVENLSAV